MCSICRIRAERERQEALGYTTSHDVETNPHGELAVLAAIVALDSTIRHNNALGEMTVHDVRRHLSHGVAMPVALPGDDWPLDRAASILVKYPDPLHRLAIAGAAIVAEMERIQEERRREEIGREETLAERAAMRHH